MTHDKLIEQARNWGQSDILSAPVTTEALIRNLVLALRDAGKAHSQVLEAFLGKLAGSGAYALDFTSAEALHGHVVSLLKRDVAALRAAGGVR